MVKKMLVMMLCWQVMVEMQLKNWKVDYTLAKYLYELLRTHYSKKMSENDRYLVMNPPHKGYHKLLVSIDPPMVAVVS